ncbi:MAG: hypothetical protein AAGI66_08540 [Cyanobacteria bacterium P01_H01_bin.74]
MSAPIRTLASNYPGSSAVMSPQMQAAQLPAAVFPSGGMPVNYTNQIPGAIQPPGFQPFNFPTQQPSVASALANPGAQSEESLSDILPTPKDLLYSVPVTMVALPLIDFFVSKLTGVASFVDRLPGIQQLGRAFDQTLKNPDHWVHKLPLTKNLMLSEALLPPHSQVPDPNDLAFKAEVETAVGKTIASMEKQQLGYTLKNQFAPFFNGKSMGASARKAAYDNLYHGANAGINLMDPNSYTGKTLEAVHDDLGQKIKIIKEKASQEKPTGWLSSALSDSEKALLTRLKATKARLSNLMHYKTIVREQATNTARQSALGIGPVGRAINNLGFLTQQLIGGDINGFWQANLPGGIKPDRKTEISVFKTLSSGGPAALVKKLPALIGKYSIPLIAGVVTFASSLHSADKAKPGEKKAAFFEDLLGGQIAAVIGWSFGKRVLNAVGFTRIFGRMANRIIIPGLNATVGGVATELMALFYIGGKFQAVGEKVSHLLFGKPTSKEDAQTVTSQENLNSRNLTQQPTPLSASLPLLRPSKQNGDNAIPKQAFSPYLPQTPTLIGPNHGALYPVGPPLLAVQAYGNTLPQQVGSVMQGFY